MAEAVSNLLSGNWIILPLLPKLGDLSSRPHSSGARGLRSSVGSAMFPLREQGKHLVQGSAGF